MGTINKKYNRQIKQCKCPLCGSQLGIGSQNRDWWVKCTKDMLHIPQYIVHHPEEAVAYAIKHYKGADSRMTEDEFWLIVIVVPLAFLLPDVIGVLIGTYIRYKHRSK